MAVYWDLGAVCATKAQAETFAAWFGARSIPLSDGTSVSLRTSAGERGNDFLVWVWPEGMSYGSPHGNRYDLVDTDLRYEIEDWIYEQLEACPPFEAAFFGGEAHDRLYDETLEELFEDPNYLPAALVISLACYDRLGRPAGFAPFSDGYLWNNE